MSLEQVKVPFKRYPPVPDGWFDYRPYGVAIGDTKILAVKTPLKKTFNNGYSKTVCWRQPVDYKCGVCTEDEFSPQQMVEGLAERDIKLTAVIDLTFTKRYYNASEFGSLGVKHSKIKCPGKEVPSESVYSRFAGDLKRFLNDCVGTKSVVAVHCTHGLNRTGYLVCRYLMEEMSFSADEAIAGFNKARGYAIERENYLDHLKNGCPPLPSTPHRHKDPSKATHSHNPSDTLSWRQPDGNTHHDQWYPDSYHTGHMDSWTPSHAGQYHPSCEPWTQPPLPMDSHPFSRDRYSLDKPRGRRQRSRGQRSYADWKEPDKQLATDVPVCDGGGRGSYTPSHRGGHDHYIPSHRGGRDHYHRGGRGSYKPSHRGGCDHFIASHRGGRDSYTPSHRGGRGSYISSHRGACGTDDKH